MENKDECENPEFRKEQKKFVRVGKSLSLSIFHALHYKSCDVYITFKIAFRTTSAGSIRGFGGRRTEEQIRNRARKKM
jgi:hypothetical protein